MSNMAMAMLLRRLGHDQYTVHGFRSSFRNWAAGYAAIARGSRLAPALHVMDAALEVVGECLNPILNNERAAGVWVPERGWTD